MDISLQVMNMEVKGSANVEELEKLNDPTAEQVNQYIDFKLINKDREQVVADAEFYNEEEVYTYYDYVCIPEPVFSCGYVPVTETRTRTELRFVFGDGSKADADSYFNDGFDNVKDELEELADALSEKF
ncbi:MAG: hypothetical protein HC842_07160 [Cytophagales bacterium]|nr:hypothetical protein [Cytophagales bacterium]